MDIRVRLLKQLQPVFALAGIRKASLTAPVVGDKLGKKGAITRFCPDGQPMKGSSCGPGLRYR